MIFCDLLVRVVSLRPHPRSVSASWHFFSGSARIGSGIYLTAGVLYFAQAAHLPAGDLLVIGNVTSCAASAAFLVRLPPAAPVPAVGGPRWIALRDLPHLLVTALDGVMSIQFKVLTVALPIWLIEVATAPRWLISATMLVNTAIVTPSRCGPAAASTARPRAAAPTGARAWRSSPPAR